MLHPRAVPSGRDGQASPATPFGITGVLDVSLRPSRFGEAVAAVQCSHFANRVNSAWGCISSSRQFRTSPSAVPWRYRSMPRVARGYRR